MNTMVLASTGQHWTASPGFADVFSDNDNDVHYQPTTPALSVDDKGALSYSLPTEGQ